MAAPAPARAFTTVVVLNQDGQIATRAINGLNTVPGGAVRGGSPFDSARYHFGKVFCPFPSAGIMRIRSKHVFVSTDLTVNTVYVASCDHHVLAGTSVDWFNYEEAMLSPTMRRRTQRLFARLRLAGAL
jgi:hypothetical protein